MAWMIEGGLNVQFTRSSGGSAIFNNCFPKF